MDNSTSEKGLDLDAIEARARAATLGPWTYEKGFLSPSVAEESECGEWKYNGRFIAHARTDVPALVGEVRRLRSKNDALARELAVALERERLLRADLAVVATDQEGVWRWQGDGEDHLESLSCPVVTLREMLATRVLAAEHLRTWQRQAGPGHPLTGEVDAALAALGERGVR